jgi:peroxiredoxin
MAQLEPLKKDITKAGASLAFIAAQSPGGLFDPLKYLSEHPVPFPFLLDADRCVTKAYGVYHLIGLDAFNIARPATFIVDRKRIVRFIHVGSGQTDRTPLEEIFGVLDVLRASETTRR